MSNDIPIQSLLTDVYQLMNFNQTHVHDLFVNITLYSMLNIGLLSICCKRKIIHIIRAPQNAGALQRSVCRPSVCAYVLPVRKKWLSPFYSTLMWYIPQTYTNCSSWHDILMPHGGLCPWPTFHSWVTMVRKKLFSLLQYLWVLHSPQLHQLLILTWSTDVTWWFVSLN